MNFHTRLALLIYHGEDGNRVSYFTDALTQSTFSIRRGQTIGEGLQTFIDRWEAAKKRFLMDVASAGPVNAIDTEIVKVLNGRAA